MNKYICDNEDCGALMVLNGYNNGDNTAHPIIVPCEQLQCIECRSSVHIATDEELENYD